MSIISNSNNTNNPLMQISQTNNNNNKYNKSIEEEKFWEINEKQINYVVNLFILHGIFTSFEMRTKYL